MSLGLPTYGVDCTASRKRKHFTQKQTSPHLQFAFGWHWRRDKRTRLGFKMYRVGIQDLGNI